MIKYKDLVFEDEEDRIKVNFYRIFYFYLNKKDLDNLGEYRVHKDGIEFREDKNNRKLGILIDKGFTNLKNKISSNPAVYIHKNSGVPLIGSLSFGIVDKGTNLLEIKPVTSCNVNCIFCSVDEGPDSSKIRDIVVEKDYLVDEIRKLMDYKKEKMHLYINPQGEPLLYAPIVELIADLSKIKYVKDISIITNGSLLTEDLVQKLVKAGLTELHISLNSMDVDLGKKLAGMSGYDVKTLENLIIKIKDKIKIVLTPVLVGNINKDEIQKLCQFANENNISIMIQNYRFNKRGRNPTKPNKMNNFFNYLEKLEKKYNLKLNVASKLVKTKEFPKPFKVGDKVISKPAFYGRYNTEYYAVSKGRVIVVNGIYPSKKTVSVKITRDSHNLYSAV